MLIEAQSVQGAYEGVLRLLRERGAEVPCQSKPTREIVGAKVIITHPRRSIITLPERKFNYRYALAEAMWNLLDRSDIGFLSRFSKGITKFVADQPEASQDHAHWAYGPQIHDQIGPAIALLKEHPDSRRAIWRPGRDTRIEDRGLGTPPCLEFVQFLIRGEALHIVVFMRSNDAYLGMPYDMFTYSLWQIAMANALGVEVGTYTHMVGSLHYYMHDLEKIENTMQFMGPYHQAKIASAPDMREVANCALMQDLITLEGTLEHAGEAPRINQWRAPSWGPLLNVLQGNYEFADGTFRTLQAKGIGVGW